MEAAAVYQALVVSAETGIMWDEGGLVDQPDWWVEMLSWFLPYYSDNRFYSRARAILGDGKEVTSGNNHRRRERANSGPRR